MKIDEEMINVACAAHDPKGWRIASGETISDMKVDMRRALEAVAVLLAQRNRAEIEALDRAVWGG